MRQAFSAHSGSLVKSLLTGLFGPPHAKRGNGVLALLAAVSSLVCLALITAFPWGRDQSIYAVIGHGMLQHQVPYRDLWDFKPPGIYFVYAAAEACFGENMAAIRWLEVCGLSASILCMVALSRRFQGSSLAGWCAAAFLTLAHVMLDFWHTAQPESFGGMLTLGALALIVPLDRRTTTTLQAYLAGALLGAAGLMKPQLAGGLIVFAAYVFRQVPDSPWFKRLWPLLVLGFGALTPLLACALYFVTHGAWSDLWWTMHDFVPGYTALGWHGGRSPLNMLHFALVESLVKFSVYIPIGVGAAFILPSAHSREHEGIFLTAGLVVFHAVGIALQAKFFQYHYGATLPLLALMAGLGWAKLWWTAVPRGWTSITMFAVLALLSGLISTAIPDLPGSGWQRTQWRLHWLLHHRHDAMERDRLDAAIARVAGFDLGADQDVATWIKGQTGPSDSVLVWGFEPAIYWFAQRKPSTRFIYNVAQRTAWQRPLAQRRFMDDIRRNKPLVVIVQHADIFPSVTGGAGDSAADLADFPELSRLLQTQYDAAGYRYNFEYFRRREGIPVVP